MFWPAFPLSTPPEKRARSSSTWRRRIAEAFVVGEKSSVGSAFDSFRRDRAQIRGLAPTPCRGSDRRRALGRRGVGVGADWTPWPPCVAKVGLAEARQLVSPIVEIGARSTTSGLGFGDDDRYRCALAGATAAAMDSEKVAIDSAHHGSKSTAGLSCFTRFVPAADGSRHRMGQCIHCYDRRRAFVPDPVPTGPMTAKPNLESMPRSAAPATREGSRRPTLVTSPRPLPADHVERNPGNAARPRRRARHSRESERRRASRRDDGDASHREERVAGRLAAAGDHVDGSHDAVRR